MHEMAFNLRTGLTHPSSQRPKRGLTVVKRSFKRLKLLFLSLAIGNFSMRTALKMRSAKSDNVGLIMSAIRHTWLAASINGRSLYESTCFCLCRTFPRSLSLSLCHTQMSCQIKRSGQRAVKVGQQVVAFGHNTRQWISHMSQTNGQTDARTDGWLDGRTTVEGGCYVGGVPCKQTAHKRSGSSWKVS